MVSRRNLGPRLAAAIGVCVFALAFVVAPRSCEGGLELYVWVGVAALAALLGRASWCDPATGGLLHVEVELDSPLEYPELMSLSTI